MNNRLHFKNIACKLLLVMAAAFATAGCKDTEFRVPGSEAPKPKTKVVVKKVLTPENTTVKKPKAKPDVKEEVDVIAKAYDASRSTVISTGSPEEVAVRKVTGEIGKSLELGPVLVVWLLDRTASNYKLLSSATTGAKAWYESQEVKQLTLEKNKKLQSVVA